MRQSMGFSRACVCTLLLCATWPPVRLAAQTTWNVTQYGVSSNGSVDQTSAINAVIQDAQPGDTVYFPAGVYPIAGTINAKTGVAIAGAVRAMS